MTQNITDVANLYTTPIVYPSDGDARNAASIATPLQAIGNRTRWLKDTFSAVADQAGLIAYLGMADGDWKFVPGFGAYRYSLASAIAAVTNFVVPPASGTGRWIHELWNLQNVNNGIPLIGPAGGASSGKLLTSLISNWSVGIAASSTLGVTANVVSATYVDLVTTTYGVTVGDKVLLFGNAAMDMLAAGNVGTVAVTVVDPNASIVDMVPTMTTQVTGINPPVQNVIALYTVQATGTATIKLRAKTSASTLNVYAGASVLAFILRP